MKLPVTIRVLMNHLHTGHFCCTPKTDPALKMHVEAMDWLIPAVSAVSLPHLLASVVQEGGAMLPVPFPAYYSPQSPQTMSETLTHMLAVPLCFLFLKIHL